MFLRVWDMALLYPFLDAVDMIHMSMVTPWISRTIDWELYFYTTWGVRSLRPVSGRILYFGRYVPKAMTRYRYKDEDWCYFVSSSPTPSHQGSSTGWRHWWWSRRRRHWWWSRLWCKIRDDRHYFIYSSGLIMKDVYYFEIRFRSDLGNATRCLSFGLTASGDEFHYLRHHRLLIGWTPYSVGWHSDDGFIFWQNERVISEPVRYMKEDIVGCGYDYHTREIFFSHNGQEVFRQYIPTLHTPVGCISMDYPFHFDINFGQVPFLLEGARS